MVRDYLEEENNEIYNFDTFTQKKMHFPYSDVNLS